MSNIDEDLANLLSEVESDDVGSDDVGSDDVEDIISIVASETNPVAEVKESDDIIKSLIDDFRSVKDRIISDYAEDRRDLQEVVDHIKQKLIDGERVSAEMAGVLVSALSTKAQNNTTVIKMLDAFAKLIASTKNTPLINQQTLSISSEDLERLLQE